VRIAFYAPLKPPDHPVPSGDRSIARLLVAALQRGGHRVELACRLRSRDAEGDPARQVRLDALGARLAARYVRRVQAGGASPPDLWFSYHLYYKAPDHVGPRVATALRIPYVVAEASVAAKRATGPWRLGHESVVRALAQASAIVGLNPADRGGVVGALGDGAPWIGLKPFLDLVPFAAARARAATTRAELAAELGLPAASPWLVVVAMMRPGDKLASYRVLGAALTLVRDMDWWLLVIGEGPARGAVEAALGAVAERIRWLGARDEAAIATILAACDVLVWPAVNEAYGMALLEAQAAGLPVAAGRIGGTPELVEHGATGLLTRAGDAEALAGAVQALLSDPARRRGFAEAAVRKTENEHGVCAASQRLAQLLASLRLNEC
jgi:glycosyltransferase involved in cell wall biosynthesis